MPSIGRPFGATSVCTTTHAHVHSIYIDPLSIEVRLDTAGRTGMIFAILVISRRICLITTNVEVSPSRRRMVISDLAIGLSPPIAQFILCRPIMFGCSHNDDSTFSLLLPGPSIRHPGGERLPPSDSLINGLLLSL